MGSDLSSYVTVFTESAKVTTALVAAIAGLLAILRFRRRAPVHPAPSTVYVASGGAPVEMHDDVSLSMRAVARGTVTRVPRWMSSTRTPLILIAILTVAIATVLLNREREVRTSPAVAAVPTATGQAFGIGDAPVITEVRGWSDVGA